MEAVEILLKYIKEFKTKCEFNGVDFEADLYLSTMYTEIRRCMHRRPKFTIQGVILFVFLFFLPRRVLVQRAKNPRRHLRTPRII